MKTTRLLALVCLVAVPALADPPAVARYVEDVKTLAAPDMHGRGAGTPGIEKAAHYIADSFEDLGLEPAGTEEYFQPFTLTTGAELGGDNALIANSKAGEKAYRVGEDWTPINFSAAGQAEGGVVFAGYGITADERGYDDYAHLDVDGKIVVVLRYEPPSFHEGDNGKRKRYTHHANLISKAINARNRGAAAVVLVNGSSEQNEDDELIKFGSIAGPDNSGIIMVQVRNQVVERWFRRSNRSLTRLQRDIDGRTAPDSFQLGSAFSLKLSVDVERKQAEVSNVLGYIPGRTDEYVVVGAHYDHLGLGGQSSLAPDQIGEIHHGADDNASGVAGLLEIARRFANESRRPERGLLLIAFAGEEIGLLGSAYWTENPTKPIENAVAMLNMDMIGRINKGKVYVGGVGTAEPLQPLVERLADARSFETDFSRSGYSASDHTSFTAKGVPVLFFFSGLHSDYHKPSDTWEKINGEAAIELVDLVGDVVEELRGSTEELTFIKEAPEAQGPHGGSSSGGGGYGPYFGSIPDFAEVPNGVRFADVRPGSPADKGGLKGGDVMIGYDGKPIQNLYDFTYALRDSEVGQTVEVRYLRDGREATTKVTLEKRR